MDRDFWFRGPLQKRTERRKRTIQKIWWVHLPWRVQKRCIWRHRQIRIRKRLDVWRLMERRRVSWLRNLQMARRIHLRRLIPPRKKARARQVQNARRTYLRGPLVRREAERERASLEGEWVAVRPVGERQIPSQMIITILYKHSYHQQCKNYSWKICFQFCKNRSRRASRMRRRGAPTPRRNFWPANRIKSRSCPWRSSWSWSENPPTAIPSRKWISGLGLWSSTGRRKVSISPRRRGTTQLRSISSLQLPSISSRASWKGNSNRWNCSPSRPSWRPRRTPWRSWPRRRLRRGWRKRENSGLWCSMRRSRGEESQKSRANSTIRSRRDRNLEKKPRE